MLKVIHDLKINFSSFKVDISGFIRNKKLELNHSWYYWLLKIEEIKFDFKNKVTSNSWFIHKWLISAHIYLHKFLNETKVNGNEWILWNIK